MQKITAFSGRVSPVNGFPAGYGALIVRHDLKTPLPGKLSIIGEIHKRYETEEWYIFPLKYAPGESLSGQLTFALKYEGVDLGVLKSLFSKIAKKQIEKLVSGQPTGKYSRRIWFLYEWLMEEQLDIPNATSGNFVDLLNPKLQYAGKAEISQRHRVRNNLPGVRNFCPLIRRTTQLDALINEKLTQKTTNWLSGIHKEVLLRASAFLLLKDSKASYAIEGESPPQSRAQRWGKAIGQAGRFPLSKEELLRLQQIVIGDSRFVDLGWRKQAGFVGEHDRNFGTPIPEHISAKWEEVETLIDGLLETNEKLQTMDFDAVLAATLIAFGFVFIHPFVDGNGRIHRYLIHHVLRRKQFYQQGLVFPVSAAIFQRMEEYRTVLESFSQPRLDLIEWTITPDNNVEVLNETIDLYRYFDATKAAEFLYHCVKQTLEEIIPEEVDYLYKYDRFKAFVDSQFEMPDKMVSLLVQFLHQGNGRLSKRAKKKEFHQLQEKEIDLIERYYFEVFFE